MRVLKSIERDWRNALRRLIRQRGLVDTGALVESVEVSAEIDDFGVCEITIDAVDYIKYLYEPFKLYEFVNYSNIASRAYFQWLNEKAKQFPFVDWKGKWQPKIIVNLPE